MRTFGLAAATLAACLTPAVAAAAEKELYRASALDNVSVVNGKGESLGTVRDFAVRAGDEKIAYAVLGHGGVAGVGEKYFAVPYSAMQLKATAGKPNDRSFVLDVDKATLESQAGFKKDALPPAPDTTVFKGGTKVSVSLKPADEKTPVRLAKSLYGTAVRNSKGEDLGKLYDLMISHDDGSIKYAAVNYGSTLGVGGKLFAVDWDKMALKATEGNANEVYFLLDVDKATLEAQPGFDKNAWPREADDKLMTKTIAK